nr:MAG TPA: hypothetical protein [Caudoviricetes sp.]
MVEESRRAVMVSMSLMRIIFLRLLICGLRLVAPS